MTELERTAGLRLMLVLLGIWLFERAVNADQSGRTLIDYIVGNKQSKSPYLQQTVSGAPTAASPGAVLSGSLGSAAGLFKAAYSKLQLGRLDQGVDFSGTGPVAAIADGTVTHVGLWPGWPGSGGIVYQTAVGNIYVMEHFTPAAGIGVGSKVTAGEIIGQAPGGYPYIETGFANSSSSGPLTPYNGAPDGTPMPGALKFKQLLGL